MQQERRIKHYSNYHKILLVGEGDFSFSVSLANAFGSATNMVATSLDSQAMVMSKYPSACDNLELLRRLGCTIVHEVDACTMSSHLQLWGQSFDRIVFNFPHTCSFFGKLEHWWLAIDSHRDLVKGFFGSAVRMLKAGGEIHVTHKTNHPYCDWRIEDLAKGEGLSLFDTVSFNKDEYPEYENKKGDGTDSTFFMGSCATYKFVL